MPLAGAGVSVLVLRGSFHRVEHVLLALSTVFVTYIASGFLAHPDWGQAVTPSSWPLRPGTRFRTGSTPPPRRCTPTGCPARPGVLIAGGLVLIPGAPLIQILFRSQALNAILLLVVLPVMGSLASDATIMGEQALARRGRIVTGVFLALIAASVLTLGVLTVAG